MRIFHLVEAGRGSEPQLGMLSPSRPVPSPKEPAAAGAAAHLGLWQDKERRRRAGAFPALTGPVQGGRPSLPLLGPSGASYTRDMAGLRAGLVTVTDGVLKPLSWGVDRPLLALTGMSLYPNLLCL